MSNKKANNQRYEGYILAVVEVGEELNIKTIWDRVWEYNPYENSSNPHRSFHHKDMPNTRGLGVVLRDSGRFVLVKPSTWRRTE